MTRLVSSLGKSVVWTDYTFLKTFFLETQAQVKRSAYTFVRINKLKNPFKKINESAGRYWLEWFLGRNLKLSWIH